ncbi:MAG: leucyl aminopeptidase [Pyrinomonadaceae bacterium]|jgi:leucyl aminopeptidase|nr:leucyl aminopeptidase [Pyrinomonadaceae bacterium]
MDIQVSTGRVGEVDVQALAVAVFKDEQAHEGFLQELDAATGGLIKSVIESEELKGKEGETVYLHLGEGRGELKAKRLLLVGVGERESYKAAQVSQMAGTAARALRARNVKTVGLIARGAETDAERSAEVSVEGVLMSLFEPDKYRTVEKEERVVERLVIVAQGANEDALRRGAERGRIIGESVNFTRDLANEPGAYMTPTIMAERARAIASEFGLEVDILDRERMEGEGMGSLLSVARGSEEPPALIILKYTPAGFTGGGTVAGGGEGLLAFVGKGVTFDTGGISIKPGENMELMKYDMTGGATVLGVMRAAAQLKPPMPLLGVVPAVENMPSGKATKPGDVVRAMSGKTIEVINTDAEGRLILADAIAYARKLGATQVVDLATLTGAVSIALGDVNTGILGTDQELIDEVIAAGREVGEKLWQLPLDKEYTRQIKSDIADIKNVGGRKAGTITAAAFLKEFADGISWAHLDIAGTAWGDDAKPYRSKGPTGVAVRTLLNLIERAVRASSGDKGDKGDKS